MTHPVRQNAVAYRPGATTITLEGASVPRRGKPRQGRSSLVGWLAVATFCYLLSGQALGIRDPVGRSLGWYIYVELALFMASLTIAASVWAMHGVARKPSRSLWLFLTFGLIALFSSVRSFWPALSVVQGCLFCLVLLLAELLCTTFSPAAILRATYYSIVGLFLLAILIGAALPDTYPLTVGGELARRRLALFTYTHGDFAYVTGSGFFIGRLPAVRARWCFQGFLVALTVASRSRACTLALIVIWAAIELGKAKACRPRAASWAAVGGVLAVGLFLENNWFPGVGAEIRHCLEAFYGSEALGQSPWGLSGRVELWEAAARTFGRCVLLGFGLGGARDQLLRLWPWAGQAHNGLLELFLAAGSGGLIAFLTGWIFAIRGTLKTKATRPALAIHCFLLIVATTGPSFTMFQYLGIFLILCLCYWTRSLSGG
jgi:hypothetical protein